MTANQIENTFRAALNLLISNRIKQAFDKIKQLVDELQWSDVNDRFTEIKQNYRLMLRYFVDGAEDPERKIIYNRMISRLLHLTFQVREELMMKNSTAYEYTQKRFYPHKLHFSLLTALYDSLYYYHRQSALLKEDTVQNHSEELKRMRKNFEALLPDIFAVFWLSTRLRSDEKTLFSRIMHPDYPGITEKCLVVSALTLNIWRSFDEEKILLLLDACQHDDQQVKQRALVGLCFALTRYNDYFPYMPQVRNRLIVMADDSRFVDYFTSIILLIIGTNDTDRITKKMNEEILPEVMKISPIIREKMDEEITGKPEEWDEENPEWQDILAQSGVADKLQELTELQLEGADVFMSTFSMLKNFPFFNELTHWFLPFDAGFSDISQLFEENDQTMVNAFLSNNTICNSDKYSFCMSILRMSDQQRERVGKAFRMESDQLQEMSKDESLLKPGLFARNIARQYLQDLFRFYKLHPQHADFNDIFKISLDIHNTDFFQLLCADSDLREQVAEYYFTKMHYKQANTIFRYLIQHSEPTAAMYQKLGFCLQKERYFEDAVDAYLKADMIQPDDLWTIKKIAANYRMFEEHQKALEQYRHADFLQPGNRQIKLLMANCHLMQCQYQEALDIYHAQEKLNPDDSYIWKLTCWCALQKGDLFQADFYAEKLLATAPDKDVFLYAAYIALGQKKKKTAISYMMKFISLKGESIDTLNENLSDDSFMLNNIGFSNEEINLLFDEILFLKEEKWKG